MPDLPGAVDATSGGVALIRSGEVTTDQIVDVIAHLGGFAEDLRIVSTVKAGAAGTDALNARFHGIFRPGSSPRASRPQEQLSTGPAQRQPRPHHRHWGREGDRRFRRDRGRAERTRAHDLALAYAITVHKAQGSSFRKVVIPIQKTRLLDRSLFYTAITRATDLAIMVGDCEILRQAREQGAHAEPRATALASLYSGT
ncbi:ATP-binding domain-containing protein [Bradyrhizobium sp. 2TAF36]|uniref:ATP-binding domain-containing protein n=1 Tax=Bradyrhizobium sp. 2TAF36 TaxID=3233016 RepID=UPI003F900A99